MKRRIAREKAVQALYQIDMRGIESKEAVKSVMSDEADQTDMAFLVNTVNGVLENKDMIDAKIIQYLRGWTLERLSLIDRAILRIAVYEMYIIPDIPEKVSLNEAIELARAFGMDESVKFINGVLDNVLKEKEGKAQGVIPSE